MKTLLFFTLYPFHVGAYYLARALRMAGRENMTTPAELLALVKGGL